MNIKSIIAASALALTSAAHSADVVVQTNDPVTTAEMDRLIKDSVAKRLVPALDNHSPRNNYVILVSYNIASEGDICTFSVSLTGAFKDRQGNAVVINKLSLTENAIGVTIGRSQDECATKFVEAIDAAAFSVFKQFQKLNMKRV